MSYSLGNVIAKLAAERVLNAPLLLHHDVYARYLSSARRHRDSRPDFVAWSRNHGNHWVALEAKGRQRLPTRKAQVAAKHQATGLAEVRSANVSCWTVCWTYQSRGVIYFWLQDPTPTHPPGESLKINLTELAREYYAPVVPLLKAAERLGTREGLVLYHSRELDVSVAVLSPLAKALESEHPEEAANVIRQWKIDAQIIQEEPLGGDGLAVIPGESWL